MNMKLPHNLNDNARQSELELAIFGMIIFGACGLNGLVMAIWHLINTCGQ